LLRANVAERSEKRIMKKYLRSVLEMNGKNGVMQRIDLDQLLDG
jgi:hypothetical protein